MFTKKQSTWMSSLLATVFILFALSCNNKSDKEVVSAKSGKKYTRYNIYDPKAEKYIEDLKIAYKKMRELSCDSTYSWYYQGAIHQSPEIVYGTNKFCPGYQQTSQAKPVWNSCTHTGDSTEMYNFAVWHRLYTWYLEKVVRKLSGDPDFALPYWGYCDTVNVQQNRTMPLAYRTDGSPLYEQSRFDSINNGNPISGYTVQKLSLTKLFQNRDYIVFDGNLDAAPHGAMHNYLGAGNPPYHPIYNSIYQSYWWPQPNNSNDSLYGLMTSVESAGFDPIFFVHHAEIDRIWQQWTNSDRGKNIHQAGLEKYPWPYVFFDENGNKITYTAKMVMDTIYNLDYNYDDTPVKPHGKLILENSFSFLQQTPHDTVIRKKMSQKITGKELKFSVEGKAPVGVNLFTTNENKKSDSKIVLLTVKVSYTNKAMGSYDVYVNQPAGAAYDPEGDYYAGVMNFFGSGHVHQMAGMDMRNGSKRRTKTFIYDLTDEFLANKALEKGKFDITILKNGGLKNEDVTIEEVYITTH